MRLAAIIPSAAGVGGFLSPLENRQFLVAAMDDHPPHRALSLFATNFASIYRVNHSNLAGSALLCSLIPVPRPIPASVDRGEARAGIPSSESVPGPGAAPK